MPQIEKSALVMYSSKEMFDLVNDVSFYHIALMLKSLHNKPVV